MLRAIRATISQWTGILTPACILAKFPGYSELLGVTRSHERKYKMFCFYYTSKVGRTHSCADIGSNNFNKVKHLENKKQETLPLISPHPLTFYSFFFLKK